MGRKRREHSRRLKAAGVPWSLRVRMAKAMARGESPLDVLADSLGCDVLARGYYPATCECCGVETWETVRVVDPGTGRRWMIQLVAGQVYCCYRAAVNLDVVAA